MHQGKREQQLPVCELQVETSIAGLPDATFAAVSSHDSHDSDEEVGDLELDDVWGGMKPSPQEQQFDALVTVPLPRWWTPSAAASPDDATSGLRVSLQLGRRYELDASVAAAFAGDQEGRETGAIPVSEPLLLELTCAREPCLS